MLYIYFFIYLVARVKELNGNSTGRAAAKSKEPINSSTEEVTIHQEWRIKIALMLSSSIINFSFFPLQESGDDCSVFDSISKVSELEEKAYVELKVVFT